MGIVTARKRRKFWLYRFEVAQISGKRKPVCKSGFATKKEALDAGGAALAQYNRTGSALIPSELLVSDVWNAKSAVCGIPLCKLVDFWQ